MSVARELSNKYGAVEARARREACRAAGICVMCCYRDARPERFTCATCALYMRARDEKLHPNRKQRRCIKCGGLGHNRRTCGLLP